MSYYFLTWDAKSGELGWAEEQVAELRKHEANRKRRHSIFSSPTDGASRNSRLWLCRKATTQQATLEAGT